LRLEGLPILRGQGYRSSAKYNSLWLELRERLLVAPSELTPAHTRVICGKAELLLTVTAHQQSCWLRSHGLFKAELLFQFPAAELLIRNAFGSLNDRVSTRMLRESIQAHKRPESRRPGDKNALDGFCHSAASLAFGLGVPRRRKLDSLDSSHCSGCIAG